MFKMSIFYKPVFFFLSYDAMFFFQYIYLPTYVNIFIYTYVVTIFNRNGSIINCNGIPLSMVVSRQFIYHLNIFGYRILSYIIIGMEIMRYVQCTLFNLFYVTNVTNTLNTILLYKCHM